MAFKPGGTDLSDLEVDSGTFSVDEANNRVGIGVTDPDTKLEIMHSGTQLQLSFDGSKNMTIGLDTNGYGSITPSGGFLTLPMHTGKKFVQGNRSGGDLNLSSDNSNSVVFQSTDASTLVLPAASGATNGTTFTFVFSGTPGQGFSISPNASDKIMGSIINLSGTITTASNGGAGTDNKDLILGGSSRVGDRVTLTCDGSNGWIISDGLGNWSFES